MTELEIIYGVFRKNKTRGHAHFYFRVPGYVDHLPPSSYRADFEDKTPVTRTKLTQLKQRIRDARDEGICRLREDYNDPQELGQWILEDFTRLLNQLFPEEDKPHSLDRDLADHETIAQSRAMVYVGRKEYFDRLDDHVFSHDSPLVVLGESGIGKSALVANWFLRYREQHPNDFALIHFIGGTRDSADAYRMVRRIMLEFKRRFGLPNDVPSEPDKIREEFPQWLVKVAASARIVLVLDGLNQLEDRDAATDMGWLPIVFPPNCRVILTTLPCRSLDIIRRRQWQEMTVQPLTMRERKHLLEEFLAVYGRSLSFARTNLIVSAEQAANPLFLRTLLDELRQFGEHDRLGERIEFYLAAKDPRDLYERILERWEHDYGRKLVRKSLSLIWAARRGLSEAEILDLLGENGQPLPRAKWTPLYLAAEQALVMPSGLIRLSHLYLRQALELRYLHRPQMRRLIHSHLSRYFEKSTYSPRRADELPWHQADAQQWEQLKKTLSDIDFLQEICLTDEEDWLDERRYQWATLWRMLDSRYEPDRIYEESLRLVRLRSGNSQRVDFLASIIGSLLETMGKFQGAANIFGISLDIAYCRSGPGSTTFAISLNNLAGMHRQRGDFATARHLYEQALDALERSTPPEPELLATVLNNLAMAHLANRRPDLARPLAERSLSIREDCLGPNHPGFAMSLDNVASVYASLGLHSKAIELHLRALDVIQSGLGAHSDHVATVYANLGMAYMGRGDYEFAKEAFQSALLIYRTLLGNRHPVLTTVLHNLATLHQWQGANDEARTHYLEAISIAEATYGGNHPSVARILDGLASIYHAEGKYEEAEALLQRAVAIAESIFGNRHPDTVMLKNNLQICKSKGVTYVHQRGRST